MVRLQGGTTAQHQRCTTLGSVLLSCIFCGPGEVLKRERPLQAPTVVKQAKNPQLNKI